MQNRTKLTLEKIGKYSVLLTIKESYLFSKNLFGLAIHPFKTLRQILREQDFSQAALILGLPLYLFIGGIIILFGARFLISAPTEWGTMLKFLLSLLLFLCLFLFAYLTYWIVRIWKVTFSKPKENIKKEIK